MTTTTEVPAPSESGDLLTTLTVEPDRLGRLLAAAALWTSPDKTLPGVQAIIVRVDTAARTIRAVGTDRYRLLDARMTLGEHESTGGDPILHDLWIPAPTAQGIAKELRSIRWPKYVKSAERRVIEIRIERAAYPHPPVATLPAPFDTWCPRAGLLHILPGVDTQGWPVGQPEEGGMGFARVRGVMQLADQFATAEPLVGSDAEAPFTLNSRLLADLDKIAPCAKTQDVRPWSFRQVRTSSRAAAVRVEPKHSPYPTDGVRDLDIVGHIMPIRLADKS